ncbi:hypothetical protein Cni_G13059 [Canna indica]|uniref:Cytochrome P450 n=1 Tax=Canna indica TaxID=4628 RepID=A0AAQ3K8X5_9LILI|nr:hypothetical protein Cni_G13059 [Canna indica]
MRDISVDNFLPRPPASPRAEAIELGDMPHSSLARLADVYGPIMDLRLGQVDTVVISSPDMAREVLQKHDSVFANRSIPEAARVLSYTDASLVWLPPSHWWHNLRKIYNTQLFTPQRLDAHQSLRREKVGELTQFISDSASKGLPVEIGRVAFVAALNLISRTIFSVDLVDLYEESSQKFKHVVQGMLEEAGKSNLFDYFPLLAYKHEKTKVVGNDFLDELLHYRVQEDGSKFDRLAMRSLLTDIFVAGSHTTSTTVELSMAVLLRSPLAMAKVREEIVRVIGLGRDVDEADIDALPYLQAVVDQGDAPLASVGITCAAAHDRGDGGAEWRLQDTQWHPGAWKDAGIFSPERFMTMEVEYRGMGAGLRADTVRGGATIMPRAAAGVPNGAPHARVAASEVRVEDT